MIMKLRDFFDSDDQFYDFILSISYGFGIDVQNGKLRLFEHNLKRVHYPDGSIVIEEHVSPN